MIEIHEATSEDMAGVCQVQKETWLATYPDKKYGVTAETILAKDFDSPAKVVKRQSALADEELRCWVAKDNGKVIGFCYARKGEPANQLSAIYILPEYQGKGLGRRLMERALTWMGDDREIIVEVAAYNEPTIGFYKKFGFEITEVPWSKDWLTETVYIPVMTMKKSEMVS